MNTPLGKFVILMLGGARRVSLARHFQATGQRLGYEVEIISYELFKEVPIAAVGTVVTGLKWTDPDVVDDIVRIAIEHEVKAILPFVDGAIEIAAKCKEKLPDVFIPVSDFDTCAKMFDKVEAAKVFKQNKLPIPATYSVLNAEIPAIAKPRKGSASRGIHIFNSMEDLMHLNNIQDYLLQEYITDAREFTLDCYVAQSGEVLCAVPRERLEVMGGEATRTVTVHVPELENLALKVLGCFRFRGPVTLQFLHDPKTGRFLLMEVNPRFGGGVVCSLAAGVPLCEYILEEALGIEPKSCTVWQPGTLMARYWDEVIFHNDPKKAKE